MEAREKLGAHLKGRTAALAKMRAEGARIIGIAPGGYIPEELVLASGAIPVGLIRGGNGAAVRDSTAYVMRWIDTFWRSQISYKMTQRDPLYQMIDLLVVPITDQNVKTMADCFEFYTDIPVFRLGMPHDKSEDAFKFYLGRLNLLKARLEEVTGNKIADKRLRETIDLCNKERELFREISLMRKAERPPITGREFVTLNHASFLADKSLMVEVLESLRAELKGKAAPALKGPRLILTGIILAMGDYKIFDLVEETEAEVVIEHFSEGLRDYWEMVNSDGDLMEALADGYFQRKVCHGTFRPGKERLDFITKLAKDFNVSGVIHYMTLYRDCYELDAYVLGERFKGGGLPMLKLETDYDEAEKGIFRTRVEAYVETIRQRV